MTKTHINDLFDKMEPEVGNKLDDKIQVEDSALQEIIENFFYFERTTPPRRSEFYKKNIIKKVKSKHITAFSNIIHHITKTNYLLLLGNYLSEMINYSECENHVLNLDIENLPNIGFENEKNITVNGNVGGELGVYMKSGQIILNGASFGYAGYSMEGGKIIIEGSGGKNPGFIMKGGEIYVKGRSFFDHGVNNLNRLYKDGYMKITPKNENTLE